MNDRSTNRIGAVLALITLLGLFLRLYKLDFQSFWMDEYYMIRLAQKGVLFSGFERLPAPSIIILRLWLKIFPVTETFVRMPQAIIGALSIPALFLLAKELFNKRVALWSSFFFAISAIHIDYCQEAKYYALKLFAAIIAQYFYFRILKSKKMFLAFAYSLSMAFAIYSYYYLVLLFLIQWIHLFICSRKNRDVLVRVLVAQAVTVIMLVPLAFKVFNEVAWIKPSLAWLKTTNAGSIINTTIAMFSCKYYIWIKFLGIKAVFILAGLLLLTTIIFAFIARGKFKEYPEASILMLVWLFVPSVAMYVFSKVFFPVYHVRYILVTMLALMILFGWIVYSVDNRFLRNIFIGLVVAVNMISLSYYYNNPVRPQERAAAEYLVDNVKPSDAIVFRGYVNQGRLLEYYMAKDGKENKVHVWESSKPMKLDSFHWALDSSGELEKYDDVIFEKAFLGINVYKVSGKI